jgi:NAD-dependent deacetylase
MEQVLSDFTLVTQNVDGLHQAAGNQRVLELHGNIWRVRCTACGWMGEDHRTPLPEIPPRCECGGLLRPDVVWFGESLPSEVLERAWNAAARCRYMLVVGTSAVVQPAASLPGVAKRAGARLIEVNVNETPITRLVDEVLRGPAGELLPSWWEDNCPQ